MGHGHNILPSSKALRTGDPCEEKPVNQRVERGTIVSVNPNTLTCDVITTETQSRLTGLAFPNLAQDPQGSGGHIEVPRVGTQVYVQRGLGTAFITGFQPVSVSRGTSRDTSAAILGLSGQGSAAPKFADATFLGALPTGLKPGDWMHIGNQGQFIGLFDQGTVGLYAGPWSHVLATLEDDTLNIAARNFNLRTGVGNLICKDYGGKQSLLLQLGTDQMTETGSGKENYPLTLKMGGDAEGLLDMLVTDRRGTTVYKRVISASGQVREEATGPQDQTYKGGRSERVEGDRALDVQGSESLNITGDRIEAIAGSVESAVSQNLLSQVMNDRTDFVNRNWDISVGRNMNMTVSGAIPPIPGMTTAQWMFLNGSLVIDIGKPGTGVPAPMQGFNLNTYMPQGDIVLDSLAGKIIANTVLPDSVLLGASKGVATFHTVKWELGLQVFLQQLLTWLDAHTHPTGVGPSGPATLPMGPASGLLTPLMTAIPSVRVLVGL